MEHHVVERVDALLKHAYEKRASDVHLEPTVQQGRIRFRIDGILSTDSVVERLLFDMMIARLKVIAGMNVTQKRLAQDGKLIYQSVDGDIDVRVSTFPCIFGEKLVLRILNSKIGVRDFQTLGMSPELIMQVEQFLTRPNGFFIVTGPTGSGKTTTLYSFLKKLNNDHLNIVTLEDPVEYTLDGITQTQIHVDIGLTFETGIRSVLRQDPDVIFIGEVRDKLTAKASIEAALTGHLVFTTMHTVDAASAVIRLYDMGIDHFLIEGALSGVLAQRLLRALCEDCKEKKIVDDVERALAQKIGYHEIDHYVPVGCNRCCMSGYVGRIGIFEYVPIGLFKKILASKPSYDLLLEALAEHNVTLLKDSGLTLVRNGRTSLAEVWRTVAIDV